VLDLQRILFYRGPHSCYQRIAEQVKEQGIRIWYLSAATMDSSLKVI